MTDPLAFWRAKLAGENTDHFPAEVYCGWWRYRGRLLRVLENEDAPGGSLYLLYHSPGMADLVEADDQFREHIFGFAAADPVTEEAADAWLDTGRWPDTHPLVHREWSDFHEATPNFCAAAARYYDEGIETKDDLRRAETLYTAWCEIDRERDDWIARAKAWKTTLAKMIREKGGKARA